MGRKGGGVGGYGEEGGRGGGGGDGRGKAGTYVWRRGGTVLTGWVLG